MKIIGIDGLTAQDVNAQVMAGGKFVTFKYCISLIVVTLRRQSNIYFIRADEGTFSKALPSIGISLIFGWWGIPWGPIFTIQSLGNALGGGDDATLRVMAELSPDSRAASA
jgi:hypothetical protein